MSEPCTDGEHDWVDAEPYCELCGNHFGFSCTKCYELLDCVWDDEEIARLGLKLSWER